MKKELFTEIIIPEGVEANIEGNVISIKGKEGEIKKEFKIGKLEIKKSGDKIILGNKKSTKNEKKIMYTLEAHILNMIKGVQKKFEYTLKMVFHHFPITLDIKGREVIVKNFLGEKIPRKTNIPEGAEIKVNKDIIIVSSIDKEIAGQAAANLERVTNIRLRDRRIFQDGIFMTNKAGKEI